MLKDYKKRNLSAILDIEDKNVTLENISESDSVQHLKMIIENELKIPAIYQCLYFESDHVTIGYEYSDNLIHVRPGNMEDGELTGDFIDKSQATIGDIMLKNKLHILNYRKYVEENVDIGELRSLSEMDIKGIYDIFVRRYWPFMGIVAFKMSINDTWVSPTYSEEITSLRDIFANKVADIESLENFTYSLPTESNKRIVTQFDSPQNLNYFFDQFKLGDKYYVIVIKLNEASVYKRYVLGNKFGENVLREPKNAGIFINDNDVYIAADGLVVHNSLEILNEVPELFVGKVASQKIVSTYNFSVIVPNYLDHGKFISLLMSYGSFVDRDLRNYNGENYISFYYKKIDTSGDDAGYGQFGSYVKITGHTNLSISANNIKCRAEIVNIYNFIIRALYLYCVEYGKADSKLGKESLKSNVKIIDPKLFSQENMFNEKHTRLCQKNKQPYAFIEGSESYEFFKTDVKNTEMLENKLVYKNLTHPNSKSVYVCPNQDYPYPAFISSLFQKNGICVPCCSSVNKIKSREYQKCIDSNNVETRESNNVYYISRYNPEKIVKNKRLVYLPDILNNFFNVGRKKHNFISLGESIYLLSGIMDSNNYIRALTETMNKILANFEATDPILDQLFYMGYNVVIFKLTGELNKDGNDTGSAEVFVKNNYDNVSIYNNIKKYKTLYFVETRDSIYYPILHLSVSLEKKYKIVYDHPADSEISVKTCELLESIINSDNPIPFTSYTQVRSNSDFCEKILVGDVVLSIKPMLFRKEIKIVDEPKAENVWSNVKKLNLPIGFDLISNDKFVGVELDDGQIVLFKPEALTKSTGKRSEFLLDIPSLRANKETGWNNEFEVEIDPELYKIFQLYVANFINVSTYPTGYKETTMTEWDKVLLKNYEKNDPNFLSDHVNLKNKNYSHVEIFKKVKQKVIGADKDVTKIAEILDIALRGQLVFEKTKQTISNSNIRKICDTTSQYSITGQCAKNGKLIMDPEKYKKFLRIVAWEIVENPIKRELLFSNTMSRIVKSGNFTSQVGTRLIKIR